MTPAWSRIFFKHRVVAGVEHIVVLRQLGDVRTVFDIGANRGQFALAARRSFPTAKILSFEPLSEPALMYRAVFKGDSRVTLFQVAIGPQTTESHMHVSARDDSSSLLPILPAQELMFPGTAEIGKEPIKVRRLTDLVSSNDFQGIALLKIDVQGFELQALAGCEDWLGRFKWIYVESSFVELYAGQALADSVIAWVRERGFTLFGVHNMTYAPNGRALQADFLFHSQSS